MIKNWFRCYNIPFTKKKYWVEIEFYRNVWLEISFREMYKVSRIEQSVLGETDCRTISEIGFRVPFRKQSDL